MCLCTYYREERRLQSLLFLYLFYFLFFGFCPSPDCFAEITTSLGIPGEDWPSWYQLYKNRNWGLLFMWFNGQLDRPICLCYDASRSFQLAFIGGTIRVELSQCKISRAYWLHINNADKKLLAWKKGRTFLLVSPWQVRKKYIVLSFTLYRKTGDMYFHLLIFICAFGCRMTAF